MTSFAEKIKMHEEASIRMQAMKIIKDKEVEQLVSLFKPQMEPRLKQWIQEEVKSQVAQHLAKEVKNAVAVYCQEIFNSNQQPKEEYMTVKVDEAELDELPVTRPELIRSIAIDWKEGAYDFEEM
jgi:hypothetical protein